MSYSAAKLDIKSLGSHHKSNYLPVNEELISEFFRKTLNCTWTADVEGKMKMSRDNTDLIYTSDKKLHTLNSSYFVYTSPNIKVRPQYLDNIRICFGKNPGLNLMKHAEFHENKMLINTLEDTWVNMYHHYFRENKPGGKRELMRNIGNVPELQAWGKELKAYDFIVEQPWFYSFNHGMKCEAFKMFLSSDNAEIEHIYTFHNSILDLVKIEHRDGDEWKPVTLKNPRKYLDISKNTSIEPELWGRYTLMVDNERKKYMDQNSHTFHIRDIVSLEAKRPSGYGTVQEVELLSKDECIAMFWGLENQSAKLNKDYSVFTDNLRNPIQDTSLTYRDGVRFNKMSSCHFSKQSHKFPSAPFDDGYHARSNATNPTNLDQDVGIVYTPELGATLRCSIEAERKILPYDDYDEGDGDDNDIIPVVELEDNDELEDEHFEVKKTKFLTKVVLLVVKKLTATKDASGKFKFSLDP